MARPRKIKSVKAMERAIDAYFASCEGTQRLDKRGNPVYDKHGQPVMIGAKPPTVTGLALALGLSGRKVLLDYQGREEYRDTITRAKARCEAYAEERLYDKDGSNGAKFSLGCNFGWASENERHGDPAAFAALISAITGGGNDAH